MKVAQIIPNIGFGGAEREVVRLTTALNRAGVDCEIICLYEEGHLADRVKHDGVQVTTLNLHRNAPIYLKFLRLTQYLHKSGVEVAHIHLINWATISARLAGIKAVFLSEHGLSLYKNRYQVAFDRFNALYFISYIIVVAMAIREERLNRWKIPEDKLIYLPNSIDFGRFDFSIDKKGLKNELGIPPNDFFVLSVGSLLPVKGHTYLISAAAKVLAKFSNVTFAIAGGGALMNSLVQQVSALGISHKFIFFGYREDVERLLKLADIFVISSLREGTSIAILEAMAAGVPVIATRVGGNPELIQDHVSGLLVRPCDPDLLAQAIIKLLQDKNLSGRFKQAARETAIGKYSEVVNLNRLIDLYKEVLYAKR